MSCFVGHPVVQSFVYSLLNITDGSAPRETAEKFFERVGLETNTCIIWPSRLKVGAKSKKDPHIRVGGDRDGVKRARRLIIETLDTRCLR